MIRSVTSILLVLTLVKLFAFLKEVFVAKEFGLAISLDAFLLGSILVYFIQSISYVFISSVLMPEVLRFEKSGDKQSFNRFLSSLIYWTILIAILISSTFWIFSDVVVHSILSSNNLEYFNLVRKIFVILLPLLIFIPLHSIFSSVLNAHRKFVLSTISPVLSPTLIVLTLLIYEIPPENLVIVMAFVTLGGSFLEMLIVLLGVIRSGYFQFKFIIRNENLGLIMKQFLPSLGAISFLALNNSVDFAIAVRLGENQLSILNYATKLSGAAVAVLSGIWIVSINYFTQSALENNWVQLKYKLNKILFGAIFTTLPMVILLYLFSLPLVRLFFERGNFEYSDSLVVAPMQAIYFLNIPTYLSMMILIRFFSALNRFHSILLVSIFSFCLNLFLNLQLTEIYGINGIAVSTFMVTTIMSVILYIYALRIIKQERVKA